jgi:hypothetical protein
VAPSLQSGAVRIAARMERAAAAGSVALILTLDWSFSHGRDWGSPSIPDKIGVKTAMQFAPEVMRRYAGRRRPWARDDLDREIKIIW